MSSDPAPASNSSGLPPATPTKVLQAMLDRLFASIMTGPSMNCRPHHSRQRIDLFAFNALQSLKPEEILQELLSAAGKVTIEAQVKAPAGLATGRWRGKQTDKTTEKSTEANTSAPIDPKHRDEWNAQQQVLSKLRIIAQEADTYEQDTGVYILNLGFPLLSLPPGLGTVQGTPSTRRVLAPLAFMPIVVEITAGTTTRVTLSCASEDIDRVHPNESLLAWIEQSTGKAITLSDHDEKGQNPWQEICHIVAHVCKALEISAPGGFDASAACTAVVWKPTPANEELGTEPRILPSAVAGLYPLANQGLLRDTKEMLAAASVQGPVRSFLTVDPDSIQAPADDTIEHAVAARNIASDRLVGPADPCQAHAVTRARTSPVLVIHGPPGTGKSQTITNIIGDALIRGERVLFVCEKRTALDVVANRLGALGMGNLCAVIHDPQRDQKTLYLSIREQLEALSETSFDPKVGAQLDAADKELERIHTELTQIFTALHRPTSAAESSLHTLIGEWLSLHAQQPSNAPALSLHRDLAFSISDIDAGAISIRDVLTRSQDIAFATNPWREHAGASVDDYFSRPMDGVRSGLAHAVTAAQRVDDTPSLASLPPHITTAHAAALTDLATRAHTSHTSPSIRAFWLNQSPLTLSRHTSPLSELSRSRQTLSSTTIHSDLLASVRSAPPNPIACNQALAAIRTYQPLAGSWLRILAFGKRSAATAALATFGLPLTPENLSRAESAYAALLAMHGITDALTRICVAAPNTAAGFDPDATARIALDHLFWSQWLHDFYQIPLAESAHHTIQSALRSASPADGVSLLKQVAARAQTLADYRVALESLRLLKSQSIETLLTDAGSGQPAAPAASSLHSTLDTLDDVLRIKEMLGSLPPPLADALHQFAIAGVEPDEGQRLLRVHALSRQISARLASDPAIRQVDAKRISQLFDRFSDLTLQRQGLCQARAQARWIEVQRARLLVGTGSKLNSAGAAIKTRLLVRGSNALRLRQVIQHGAKTDGGDPLFDLRPVWMASPETVAQIFPREPLFDVLIFDEASQLKLEDALPVLTRAKRIVIAGDPKQLPPTRFFESAAAATTTDDENVDSDSDLFESQQAKAEDLLSAALSMNVDQSYLDVHYRSRNSDLIEFSNNNFYGGRLQAIPGHPRNSTTIQPLVLYEVGGTYSNSLNSAEADQVVTIVRDLLKRADPPSIGIGCFNLKQRDLISERLEEAAEADAEFAQRYAQSLKLMRKGSFEGLFVKNLENVQGDERDHIIISTTYGPDEQGKFRRNFGPLNQPGGGRRLNVLVTRARHEIHLITSIPRGQYTSLTPVPANSAPTGGWLLFAYLNYALNLRDDYNHSRQLSGVIDTHRDDPSLPALPTLTRNPTKSPSALVEAFAHSLLSHGSQGGEIYWGNDGFAVDHALAHPEPAERLRGMVTVGVQCDFARFSLAQDQVEWDIFRSSILQQTGWTLHRLWSPALFRDLDGQARLTLKRAADMSQHG
ncbi:MAG: DUF4011 domain-containing protein [Planctomycetes bacterium]|nr:DUF4011 domain-containing protein [Planctomycetota bacterium]